MATIYYGVTGEGRGHATRAHTLVEHLRREHTLVIYASAMAYDMLAPLYSGSDVSVRRIPGLLFCYDKKGHLHYGRTARAALTFINRMGAVIEFLKGHMRQERPDLVITDFEPLLPRVARALDIPYISVDHQHFLKTCDLRELPLRLRIHAAIMGHIVGWYYHHQVETLVSCFYFPPLKPNSGRVTQVGVLLKPEVMQAEVSHGNYLVAYLRRFMDPAVAHMLLSSTREVRVYGLGQQPNQGNLVFKPIDAKAFITDLAGSAGLVSTAGNQLVGEALYLGKPAFLLPEPGNKEQEINGWFLQQSGAGITVPMNQAGPHHLLEFLDRLEDYRGAIVPEGICGNSDTLSAIARHLPKAPRTLPFGSALGFGQQLG